MKAHSYLKWFFLVLVFNPLRSHAWSQQQSVTEFGFIETDIPSLIDRLPSSRLDPFAVGGGHLSARPSFSPASAPRLRFEINPTRVGLKDLALDTSNIPVSANVLRTPAKAQRELDRALRFAKDQDWTAAERHLHESLRIYPEFAPAYHNLGVLALLKGDLAEGEALLERSLQLDDKSLYSLFALAQLRLAHNDFAAAQRYIDRVHALSPREPHALAFQAVLYIRQGRLNDALLTFARLEERDHQSVSEFHLVAGSVHELQNAPQRAVAEYKQYLCENPKAADYHEIAAAVSKLEDLLASH